jgi:hypothetical protein
MVAREIRGCLTGQERLNGLICTQQARTRYVLPKGGDRAHTSVFLWFPLVKGFFQVSSSIMYNKYESTGIDQAILLLLLKKKRFQCFEVDCMIHAQRNKKKNAGTL